jgi:hypothetical protein
LFSISDQEIDSLFPKVDAEAKIKSDKNIEAKLQETLKEKTDDEEESSESDGEDGEDDSEEKKKKKKEKIGFRDRKVKTHR